MENKRNVTKITNVTVDGEILNSEITSVQFEQEPEYVKLYVKDVVKYNDLPGGMYKVLLILLRNMSYGNVIPAYMPVKKMIAEEVGVGVSYVNKCINEFYVKGLLIRKARGLYIADPELFGKGKWRDIQELKLVIEYYKNGTKTIKSNINKIDEKQLEIDFYKEEIEHHQVTLEENIKAVENERETKS